jgi:hypothetical protein
MKRVLALIVVGGAVAIGSGGAAALAAGAFDGTDGNGQINACRHTTTGALG